MAVISPADVPKPAKPRWYAPTPAKFLFAVLVMQGVLFLSAYYRWFWFNDRKGYTVLITVAATAVALLFIVAGIVVSRLLKANPQFSLATLLFMVLVMAVPCGWLAWEMEQARQQWDLRALTDYDYTDPPFVSENWLTETLGADFFSEVTEFNLSGDWVTDEHTMKLVRLTYLQRLMLHGNQVTDAGLEHLKGLKRLKELHLKGTRITDAGIDQLKVALPNCEIHR